MRPLFKAPPTSPAIRILLFTNALVLLAGAMLGPIYAIFVERIGGDILSASAAGSIFALSAGITTLVSGKFIDKIKNRKQIILAGYTLMGLGFIFYIFVDSVAGLLPVQILIGFSMALCTCI